MVKFTEADIRSYKRTLIFLAIASFIPMWVMVNSGEYFKAAIVYLIMGGFSMFMYVMFPILRRKNIR